MADKSKIHGEPLVESGGWVDYLARVKREATRLALYTVLNNAMAGVALGLPAVAAQKWRNFKEAILQSLGGGAAASVNAHPNLPNLNAGEVLLFLRDDCRYGVPSMGAQRLKTKNIKGGKFHDRTGEHVGEDIRTFITRKVKEIRECPRMFPPADPANPGDVIDHVLELATGWFTQSFHGLIDILKARPANAPPTVEEVTTKLEGKLAELIESGEYKTAPAGAAFPVSAETGVGDTGAPPPNGKGGAFLSKNQLKKIKRAAKQEGQRLAESAFVTGGFQQSGGKQQFGGGKHGAGKGGHGGRGHGGGHGGGGRGGHGGRGGKGGHRSSPYNNAGDTYYNNGGGYHGGKGGWYANGRDGGNHAAPRSSVAFYYIM